MNKVNQARRLITQYENLLHQQTLIEDEVKANQLALFFLSMPMHMSSMPDFLIPNGQGKFNFVSGKLNDLLRKSIVEKFNNGEIKQMLEPEIRLELQKAYNESVKKLAVTNQQIKELLE